MRVRRNSKLCQVVALLLHDIAVITGVFVGVMAFRETVFSGMFTSYPATGHSWLFFGLYWIPTVWIGGLAMRGLYSSKNPLWEEVKNTVIGVLLGGGLIFAIVSLGRITGEVSRFVLAGTTVVLLPVLPLSRNLYKRLLFHLGIWREKIAVLIFDQSGQSVSELLQSDHYLGYEPVGVIADEEPDFDGLELEYLGTVEETEEILEERSIRNLVIALRRPMLKAQSDFLARLQQKTKRIMVAPTLQDLPTMSLNIHHFFGDDVMLVDFPNLLQSTAARVTKRGMDLFLTALMLPFLLPIIAVIALAIKLEDGGDVFYTDRRVGLNNELFDCIKFRTMVEDSEEILEEHLESNPEARKNWEKFKKLKGPDPRVTGVGHWLRVTSLDELPQIFCVLIGDMSLVGPRPMYEKEIEDYGSNLFEKYKNVKPGITGLWQVSGRNELTFADRATLDNWYIKNWSPWLDLVLLLKTIPAVFQGKGAY